MFWKKLHTEVVYYMYYGRTESENTRKGSENSLFEQDSMKGT